jgi:hypothetical protein
MSATDAAGWQSKVIMKRILVLLDGERERAQRRTKM